MHAQSQAGVAFKRRVGRLGAALSDAHPQAQGPRGLQFEQHVRMPRCSEVVLFRRGAEHPPFLNAHAGLRPKAFAPKAVEVDAGVAQLSLDWSEAAIGNGVALAAVDRVAFGPFCARHPAVADCVKARDLGEGRHGLRASNPRQGLLGVSSDAGRGDALVKLDIEACDVPGGDVQFTFLESKSFPSSSCLLTRHFPTEIVDALDHEVRPDALFVGEENGSAAFE